MSITSKVQKDMVAAMKSGDRERAAMLRYLLSQLKMGEKEAGGEMGEDEEIKLLTNEKKRRQQAAEGFRKGGSEDRAAKEDAEAAAIDEYLPSQLGDEELKALLQEAINETGASGVKELGKVMSQAMPKVGGRADGKRVSSMARQILEGQ